MLGLRFQLHPELSPGMIWTTGNLGTEGADMGALKWGLPEERLSPEGPAMT